MVDVSSPEFEAQMALVNQTLFDIGVKDKPILLVFNKVDAYIAQYPDTKLTEFQNSWLSKAHAPVVFISATEKTNINDFKQKLIELFN